MKFSDVYSKDPSSFTMFESNLNKIVEVIESHIEIPLYKCGTEVYRNNLGDGNGVTYIIGDSDQKLRFNFNEDYQLNSIDIWSNDSEIKVPAIRYETSTVNKENIEFIFQYILNPSAREVYTFTENREIISDNTAKRIMNEEYVN